METVPRLYKKVRGRADYRRSLDLLAHVKRQSPDIVTKSGLMLGLGETTEELLDVLADLRARRLRHADAGPVPGADAEAHPGGAVRAAGGVRRAGGAGADAGVHEGGRRAVRARRATTPTRWRTVVAPTAESQFGACRPSGGEGNTDQR